MSRNRTSPATPSALGRGLLRLRKRAGLSQTEAAEILGLDRKTVNRLELGRRRPFSRWGKLERIIERAILAEFERKAHRRKSS